MAIYIKPKYRRFLPAIDIFINIPLIKVQTAIFTEEMNMLRYSYIKLQWQIWKWEGKFNLYEIGREDLPPDLGKKDVVTKKCGCWINKEHKLKAFCNKHWKGL